MVYEPFSTGRVLNGGRNADGKVLARRDDHAGLACQSLRMTPASTTAREVPLQIRDRPHISTRPSLDAY